MIELISAAKVDKISETDVSLPEKVVSNQEKYKNVCLEPVPWHTFFENAWMFILFFLSLQSDN